MPRKSNKTAHVLGLITNEKSEASPDDEEAVVQKSKPARKAVVRKTAPATVESQGDDNLQLAEDIRSKLLEELDGPAPKPRETEQKISSFHPYAPDATAQNNAEESIPNESLSNESPAMNRAPYESPTMNRAPYENPAMNRAPYENPAMNHMSHENMPNNNLAIDNMPMETEAVKPLVKSLVADYPLEDFDAQTFTAPANTVAAAQPRPMPNTAAAAQPRPMSNTVAADQPKPVPNTAEAILPIPNTPAAEAIAVNSPHVPPAHAPYIYINVLEELIKERALSSMKSFDMCLCNRCVMDTMALALTQLPSKYVVVEKGEGIPLLNYYGAHFQVQVVAELTKACMTVKSAPHH